MELVLQRKQYRPDGIFGILSDIHGTEIAMTLEHAFFDPITDRFDPKVPAGSYICKRGVHRLKTQPAPFITYQVMDVEGHSNILFHCGNYNSDSDGCILLGEQILDVGTRPQMVNNSRVTFKKFINYLTGLDEFSLIILP